MTAGLTPAEFDLRVLSGSTFKKLVGSDVTFDDGRDRWTAPEGTWTDGASVPRLALSATDGRFDNRFLHAAVIHDAYCQEINKGRFPYRSRPWRDTHKMFHHASRAGRTPRVRAALMYNAVLWRGPRWNDPESEARQAPPDLARMAFSAEKQWIESEEPDLEAIEKRVAEREAAIVAIHRRQMAALEALERGDSRAAAAGLQEAEPLIARSLELAPDDLMFLNLQAYQHKNWAMLRSEWSQQELDRAAELFERVLAVEPRDASALNGLGSVAVLRGDLDEARGLILRALEEEPEYEAAWHDLRLVFRLRAARSGEE